MTLHRFELNFDLAFAYYKNNLNGTNALSSNLIDIFNFKQGNFFTLLPDDFADKNVYKFKSGGVRNCVRDLCESLILDKLLSDDGLYCIFDDASAVPISERNDSLFCSVGYIFENEIYYLVQKKIATAKLIEKCFYASDAIWHSLCILTRTNFVAPPDRNLSQENIREFCENAELILVSAYDAEGYVFWERKQV